MTPFMGIGLLFAVLGFQILNTAYGHEGGDTVTLEAELRLLRKDLNDVKRELTRKSILEEEERNRSETLQNQVTQLLIDVRNLKSQRASAQRFHRNIFESLSDLKKNLSSCECSGRIRETDVTGMKSDPHMPGLPGQRVEPDRSGENGTRIDPVLPGLPGQKGGPDRSGENGTHIDPVLPGLPGQKGEPDQSGENGTHIGPILPGLPGQKAEPDRSGENGTHIDPVLPGLPGQKAEPDRSGKNGTHIDPILPGLPGQKAEPDRCGENGTHIDPVLPGLPGQNGEPDRSGKNGTHIDPILPGLPGQNGEPDRSGENGTHIDPVLLGGLSVPEFRFTQADGLYPERVVIAAKGAAVRDGPLRAEFTIVRTDGLFPGDRRLYWETRLDWSQVSGLDSGSRWVVGVIGVRREGTDFGRFPGYDDQSWGMQIWYNHNQKRWRYYCYDDGERLFQSVPVTDTSPSASHRLGLLLDPGAGTLTAVDVKSNSRIYTFSLPAGDAGSQRLVPVVGFASSYFERRFSLPGVDPSRLPGVVTDLLQS